MYLLDTNVISELRKTKPHGSVVAWLQSVRETDLLISAVTLGEIQRGIELTREIVELAKSEFGMRKFWHKKMVPAGVNGCVK